MASDWIKMRTDLYRDPKVCMIADHLIDRDGELAAYVNQHCQRDMTVTRNVMRNVTVGALVTVWGVTRHRGKRDGNDLVVRGAAISVVDDISDLPGFGSAMESVGWLEQVDGGIVLPRFFEEFNVEPVQEQKAKNAERQRRYREKSNALRNVTVAPQSDAREEKSRVDKSIKESISTKSENGNERLIDECLAGTSYNVPDVRAAMADWIPHYERLAGTRTDSVKLRHTLSECRRKGWDSAKLIDSINFTIGNTDSKRIIAREDDLAKKNGSHAKPERQTMAEILKGCQ